MSNDEQSSVDSLAVSPGRGADDGHLEPPTPGPGALRGDWFTPQDDDPLIDYLATTLWHHHERPAGWETARLSGAVYIYRERTTGWAVVAKFYAVKSSSHPEKHAAHELELTRQATERLAGAVRAIQPLAAWRGVLLLEYVDGLTLEDVIAIRRSRPGQLAVALEQVAVLLATLHTGGVRPRTRPDFHTPLAEAHGFVVNLARYGVLQNDPLTTAGLTRAIDRWATDPLMERFVPTVNHGDATTTNFVFPWNSGCVAIDWERLGLADPAADLGRLMAEVVHSVCQHGGDVVQGIDAAQRLVDCYCPLLPAAWAVDALVERARFYQGASMLRIARNGWVPRLARTALVAQALALLSR